MNTNSVRPPRWYWIVSTVALLWMLFGVAAWVMDLMTDETVVAQYTEAQRHLFAIRPQWLFVVYGIAIFIGVLGTIGLLLRKSWASWAFAISLAAAIWQFAYTFFVMDAISILGPALALPFPLLIIAIGIALLWFAAKAKSRRWIYA